MKKTQFEIGISKLKSVYGVNKFPKERTEVLFRRLEGIPYGVFMQGVENLLLKCKFAPMMDDFFSEFQETLLAMKTERDARLKEKYSCSICRSTGRVSYDSQKGIQPYCSRCECKLGEILFPNFPTIRSIRTNDIPA